MRRTKSYLPERPASQKKITPPSRGESERLMQGSRITPPLRGSRREAKPVFEPEGGQRGVP